MEVSEAGEMDISWWINNIEDSFSLTQIPNCSFLLKTDVSKSDLSAIFDKEKSLLYINVLEMKAVLFGFKSLCSHLRQTHVKLLSDNATVVSSLNDIGSCKSLLYDQEVRVI